MTIFQKKSIKQQQNNLEVKVDMYVFFVNIVILQMDLNLEYI